jgi:hypothetical protein
LQGWLDKNSDKLARDGIVYCKSLLRPANVGFYLYGLGGGSDDGFGYVGATTDSEKLNAVEKFRRDFLEEVEQARASGARLFVISDEHCHSRLKSPTHIQRVRDLLHPLFDTIAVWCFLRPQVDMCLSLVSTLAAGGIKVSHDLFRHFMRPEDYYFNYNKLLSHWAKAFGKEHIIPIPFKRNPDTVRYFVESLSLDPAHFSQAEYAARLSGHSALQRDGDANYPSERASEPECRLFHRISSRAGEIEDRSRLRGAVAKQFGRLQCRSEPTMGSDHDR